MVLFTKKKTESPTATTENKIEALRERRSKLERQFADARVEADRATSARRAALLDGDGGDATAASKLDADVRDAESRICALADALAQISVTITDVEAQLHAERDRLAREAESKARAEQATAIEQALAGYQAASCALAAACDSVTACSHEAAEVAAVVRNLAGQIADAGANVLASTSAYVRDVASSAMPMKPQVAPRVEAPAPPPPAPVEHKTLYLFQDSCWHGADGEIHSACKHGQASVPTKMAAIAVARNLADYFDSARAVKMREAFGMINGPVHLPDCVDLATGVVPKPKAAEAGADPVVLHSAMIGEPVIGAARVMQVSGNRI
jgi:hypothetical protein